MVLSRFLSLEERVNRLEHSHLPAGSPLSPQLPSMQSPQPQGSPPVPDLPLHETYADQTSPEEDFWALAEKLQDDPDLIHSLQASDPIFDSSICISESDAGSVEELPASTPKVLKFARDLPILLTASQLQRVEGPTVYVSKVKSDAGLKRISNLDYFKNAEVRARLLQMLKEIKPAEYTFIESAQAGNNAQIGLIAQVRCYHASNVSCLNFQCRMWSASSPRSSCRKAIALLSVAR